MLGSLHYQDVLYLKLTLLGYGMYSYSYLHRICLKSHYPPHFGISVCVKSPATSMVSKSLQSSWEFKFIQRNLRNFLFASCTIILWNAFEISAVTAYFP